MRPCERRLGAPYARHDHRRAARRQVARPACGQPVDLHAAALLAAKNPGRASVGDDQGGAVRHVGGVRGERAHRRPDARGARAQDEERVGGERREEASVVERGEAGGDGHAQAAYAQHGGRPRRRLGRIGRRRSGPVCTRRHHAHALGMQGVDAPEGVRGHVADMGAQEAVGGRHLRERASVVDDEPGVVRPKPEPPGGVLRDGIHEAAREAVHRRKRPHVGPVVARHAAVRPQPHEAVAVLEDGKDVVGRQPVGPRIARKGWWLGARVRSRRLPVRRPPVRRLPQRRTRKPQARCEGACREGIRREGIRRQDTRDTCCARAQGRGGTDGGRRHHGRGGTREHLSRNLRQNVRSKKAASKR